MSLFWIGIIVFVLGVIVRYIFKFNYYRAYKNGAQTDTQRNNLSTKYRPLIFIGLGIEILGCILSFISVWYSQQ